MVIFPGCFYTVLLFRGRQIEKQTVMMMLRDPEILGNISSMSCVQDESYKKKEYMMKS